MRHLSLTRFDNAQKNEIWARIKTRPGQLYNKKQIEDDWHMQLALDYVDKSASSFRIEESEQGGLGIVFELKERPKR